MTVSPNKDSDQPNPYQAVSVSSADDGIQDAAVARPRWAHNLAQLGLVIGFGMGVVLGVQVIRMLAEEDRPDATPLSVIGAGLYTMMVVTCMAGMPLAIGGWIIGSLVDFTRRSD